MALPSSGILRISCINAELSRTATTANSSLAGGSTVSSTSLFGLANQFGCINIASPHSMSEFYNYTAIPRSNLIMYVNAGVADSYPGSGTTWTDLSGCSNNGTLVNGPTYSSANGGSITFDGVNDYACFSTSIKGANTDPFTISAVARVSSLDPAKGYVFLGRGFDDPGAYYEGWNMYIAFSSGTSKAQLGITTTSPNIASYSVSGTTTITTNTWYYVTGVWNPGLYLAIYLNGVLEGCVANSSTNLRNSACGFTLGAIGYSSFYASSVGSAQAYNRVLSSSEITQNYNALKKRFG